jgi:hypothetical protein
VQEEPREGNDNRRERRQATDQPHGLAPTPPATDWRATTTDMPTRVRTSTPEPMPTPTLTLHHFYSGRLRTLPQR